MSALTIGSIMTVTTDAQSAETLSQPPPLSPTDEKPKVSDSAKLFLNSIDDEQLKSVLFEDKLTTISDTGKEVGDFNVSIELAQKNGQACYLVHANSHGAIDGVACGTSITTYVNDKLQTLEQHHHEYVKLENHPLDRKTIVTLENNGGGGVGDCYVVNRIIRQAGDVQRSVRSFQLDEMEGFISEGSNLLLQRLLVKYGSLMAAAAATTDNDDKINDGNHDHLIHLSSTNDFKLITFDSEANISSSSYRLLEERRQIIDGNEINVVGIERTINSIQDLPTTWQTYYLKDGHMSSRAQVGSPVTMRLLNIPQAQTEDDQIEKPNFEKQRLNWRDDMQLYSKYLDRKEELKADHGVYIKGHPEVKALLGDFLQFLLLRKPDDVIEFAADFFASQSSETVDRAPFLQANDPSPYPHSRSNSKIEYLSRAK